MCDPNRLHQTPNREGARNAFDTLETTTQNSPIVTANFGAVAVRKLKTDVAVHTAQNLSQVRNSAVGLTRKLKALQFKICVAISWVAARFQL